MRARPVLVAVLLPLAFAAMGRADEDAKPPAAPAPSTDALARIDTALAFPTTPAGAWIDGDIDGDREVPPGTWKPPAGPWDLTDVLAVEIALFASPLSPRFVIEDCPLGRLPEFAGWTMLRPKAAVAAGSERRPAVTFVGLAVDEKGIPRKGVLGLDYGPLAGSASLHDIGFALFEPTFQAAGERVRIASVRNDVLGGGARLRPTLTFAWATLDGAFAPEAVDYTLPAADVPDLPAGGDLHGRLSFRRAAVAKPETEPKPVPVPEAPKAPSARYVGDKTCKKCHLVEHRSWSAGRLAKSLDTLKPTPEAERALFDKKKAAGLDPAKDYSADVSCVPCHVTGHGQPGGYPTDPAANDEAKALAESMGRVACEACHGPGEKYVAFKNAQAKAGIAVKAGELGAYGSVKPVEESCRACHNDRSPTKAPFSFEEAAPRTHDRKRKPGG